MRERKIKFTVIAKKWFDKVNGNTYHSVRCVRCKDGALIVGPYQYGYGEHYKQTALYVMFDAGWFKNVKRKVLAGMHEKSKTKSVTYTQNTICLYERENNYPILWTVSDGLKRDCIANGQLWGDMKMAQTQLKKLVGRDSGNQLRTNYLPQ